MSVLLVAGGAKGIGRAIAEAFASDGWMPVIADADARAGRSTATNLGGDFIAADVTDRAELFLAYDEVVRRHARIDCLVNTAGITVVGPSEDLAAEDWRRVLDINLTGTFLSCQAAIRHIPGGGSIINLASAAAGKVMPERAAYIASKCGVVGLTQVLALEWAPRGVRVNAVAPSWVDTPFLRDAVAKGYVDIDELATRTPAKRLVTVADVAGVARFLASPAASYISGQTLYVDAGWSLA
jgi:NAD(P)-dependent dehydrogenase (short-subunit alcohol dehydrogenase family)